LAEVTALSADFDVVLSDLAPSTTGVRDVDQQRSLELALTAWEWAQKLLRPGGHFLVKIFEGPGVGFLAGLLKKAFSLCRRVKPAGSRPASPELYLLGLNFKARPAKGQRRGKPAPQPV
jgi:23S rRNA (uridine2552-2'-O)-methyltransferase